MLKKIFFILIAFVFLIKNTNASAQQDHSQDTATIVEEVYEEDDIETASDGKYYESKFYKEGKTDTTLSFTSLSISADSIVALKNAKSFAYVKTLDSLLKAQQENKKPPKPPKPRKRNYFFENLFSSGILKIVFWAIGISVVLFLLYRLFLADGIFKRPSTKNKLAQPQVAEEAVAENSDFDLLIKQALQKNNYRLAIRYNYLKSLYALANNGLLQIAPDKTNYQYVREINNYEYQNKFSALTLHYEYVWYGEFNIDEILYKKIEGGFIMFNKNFN